MDVCNTSISSIHTADMKQQHKANKHFHTNTPLHTKAVMLLHWSIAFSHMADHEQMLGAWRRKDQYSDDFKQANTLDYRFKSNVFDLLSLDYCFCKRTKHSI